MHLVIVKYGTDAERKRIEYILDRWKNRAEVKRPEGIVALVGDQGIGELAEELYSRVERDQVILYKLQETQIDVAESKRSITVRLNEKRETAERLLDFIMAKLKATLRPGLLSGSGEKTYEVYTKKGKAEIRLRLHDDKSGVRLELYITGYGDAVELMHRKLSEEIKFLGGK